MKKQPLYMEIYNDLLKKIEEEYYKKNDLIPAEPELQNYYGVSRITIRRAIQELQDRGYVSKFSGKGTIVSDKKISFEIVKSDSFSNEVKMKGLESTSNLIEFKEITPPPYIQMTLNLGKKDKVYYIERIRKVNKKIIGLQKSYIIKKKNIELHQEDFLNNASLYEKLKENGIQLEEAVENFEAILATEEIQQKLQISQEVPIFYRERITYNTEKIPIEYVEMFYLSKNYKYKLKLKIS